jgi:hypothetical protein
MEIFIVLVFKVFIVLEKIFMNNFLLCEEITSAFPKLLGHFSWVLGQCTVQMKMFIWQDLFLGDYFVTVINLYFIPHIVNIDLNLSPLNAK